MDTGNRKVKILIVDDQLTDGEREALLDFLKDFGADVEVGSWPAMKHEVIEDIRLQSQSMQVGYNFSKFKQFNPRNFFARRGGKGRRK
jgi:hypothetical protein